MNSLDLLGLPIQMKLDGNEKYRTRIGALFTILLGILYTAAIIGFGREIVIKESAQVTFSREYQNYANITSNNFPLMVTLDQRGGVEYQEMKSLFNVSLIHYKAFINSNGSQMTEKIPLKVDNCELEDLGDNVDLYLTDTVHELSYYYCLKKNQTVILKGKIATPNFDYLNIVIDRCKNGTNIICKSKEEIESAASKAFVTVAAPDQYFYSQDRNPANLYPNRQTFRISTSFYKRIYYYYKNVDYITDRGSIWPQYENQSHYQIENFYQDIFIGDQFPQFNQNLTIAEISFTTVPIKDIYFRYYYKLQRLAADTGGIVSFFMLFFVLVNNHFGHKILNLYIFDCMFNYLDQQQNMQYIKARIKNIAPYCKNSNNNISNSPIVYNCINQNLSIINKSVSQAINKNIGNELIIKRITLKKIDIGYKFLFCRKNKEKETKLNFVNKTLNNLLDIRNFLKITNLSHILLKTIYDKNQRKQIKILNTFPYNQKLLSNTKIENVNSFIEKININNQENNFENKIDIQIIKLFNKISQVS